MRQACAVIRQLKESSVGPSSQISVPQGKTFPEFECNIKLCSRESLESSMLFQELVFEEEETLTLFPSINIACAQSVMNSAPKDVLLEESITNIESFMELLEGINRKGAEG